MGLEEQYISAIADHKIIPATSCEAAGMDIAVAIDGQLTACFSPLPALNLG